MHLILRRLVRGAAVFVLTIGVSHVFGGPIGYSVRSDVDRKLYRIDMATGVSSEIGVTGINKIEGLAINATGELFGVSPSTAQLVKCAAATGVCTVVGSLAGLPQLQTNAGLAFASNGLLYLAANAVIYRVDPATGAATALGGSGPALSGLAGVAPSAVCPSGLYGMGGNGDRGKFYCINIGTGSATLLGALGVSPVDVGLDGDPATGLVWGVSNDDPGQVFAVDPATLSVSNVNTVTLAGKAIGGFESLAVARTGTAAVGDPLALAAEAMPIPAVSHGGLVLLAIMLSLLAAPSRARSHLASRRK
mgnify:CR=1 FL=1